MIGWIVLWTYLAGSVIFIPSASRSLHQWGVDAGDFQQNDESHKVLALLGGMILAMCWPLYAPIRYGWPLLSRWIFAEEKQ